MNRPQRGRTLGGYEVLAELDSGGMGEVLIACKRAVGGFERLVALKTMRPEIADHAAAREMFLDEGRLLARLHHRGIAQVYDFGEDGDQLYLAMEYVAGIDFDELMERRPSPRIAALAVAEAARALHAAHELAERDGTPLGVVHRDVSPGNLMLTFDGAVKVLDFGIALMRNRRAPITEFGMLKGKPPYMAPEQVRSEAVDPRTDVFSACVVLWELLTGERLFTGDSIYAIGRVIEQGTVDAPSTRCPQLPAALDALVLQGLSKSPDERFQSAGSLANALESVARQLGTESLADFARSKLAKERATHVSQMDVLARDAARSARRVGRRTSVNTVVSLEDAAESDVLVAPPPALAGGTDDGDAAQTRRWPLALAALVLLFGAALGIHRAVTASSEPTAALAIADAIDAGVIARPVDAATGERSADAAPTTNAPRTTTTSSPAEAAAVEPSDKVRSGKTKTPKRTSPRGGMTAGSRRDAGARTTATRTNDTDTIARPAVAGFGTLTILHQPGDPYALIKLDGRNIGPSPKHDYKVSAGPHTIVWLEPDTNKVRSRRAVEIPTGGHKTVRSAKAN